MRKALKIYERGYDSERTIIKLALEDFKSSCVGEQWDMHYKNEREKDFRPMLTINKVPTNVRQVTGDIGLMCP